MQYVQPQSRNLRDRSFVLVVMLATCAGCPQRKPAPPPKPFAGQTIRVIVPEGPARSVFASHGQIWARANDAQLQYGSPSSGPSADGDIIVFNPAQMGELVAAGRLERVPDAMTTSGSWAGLSRTYRNKLLLWGETAYALPIVGDATLMIYRADVFKSAGIAPPKTIAEYFAVAKQLAHARQKPSLPPLSDDEQLDREFHTLAAGEVVPATTELDLKEKKVADAELTTRFGFLFDTTTGEPRLQVPGFATALTMLQQLQPMRSNAASFVAAFAADEAVLGLGRLADLAQLQPAQNAGRYGVAAIPASHTGQHVPYLGPGGFIAGVVKNSAHQSAAWELLAYLSSPDVSLEIIHDPTIGSAPFRNAHLIQRREGWLNYGLNEAATEQLREALRTAMDPNVVNAPVRLRIPRQEEYRRALLAGLRSAIDNKTEPKPALDQINQRWRELDAKVPKEQRLMDYLRSLNLRP